ncbi:restriction endonuclease subunit S [Staphylococcus arlettae]|uniref:restriction endonuclease subunit S n=1 Tax=Staphylococcus arlettae TaxID=29378 RepID=UPI0028A3088D|nr:restriction endonuclease subunit S [Staphylococcus arlettae]MDT4050267.1 restriction endonuclease subunit S [Staphylococcus arlettae]
MEFKEFKIKNVASLVTDYVANGSFKSLKENVFVNEQPDFAVLIRLVDYNNNFNGPFKYIDEKGYNFLSKTKLFGGEIIISNVGANAGTVFKAPLLKCNMTLAPNSILVKFNGDNDYFYYYLKSKLGQHKLKSILSGSAQPKFNKTDFKNLEIEVPDEYNQHKIGKSLKIIDSKIEINKKIIANLEELSQTLFKRWFVDFEFPDENGDPYKSSGGEMVDSELGEIPKGWNVKNLDDIANYMNGLAMQKFKPTDNQNSLPVVKIKELKNGSTDENSNRCTSEIPEKALIVDGDIIFSWSATLLVKMWCGGKAGLNQHLFKVSSDKYPKWFYYYWTKRYIDYFIGIANDKATTMGHINRKHLSHAKILIPNDQTLERFSRTFDDLLEKELSVSKESKRLTELRDTLLPKLMSGEIEIPDDIEVHEDELSI